MPKTRANGIEIEFDTFGDASGRPLLLIMGLGAQMILWDEEFCGALADRGHHVIRYDNRDVGLSTKLDEAGPVDVVQLMMRAESGQPVEAPYLLSDMADDAAALLDALDIAAAHVVGASMGGMIAQGVAIDHPDRVLTLTSIMSSTGDRELPRAKPEAMEVLMTPAPPDREGNIERAIRAMRVIGSPGFELDEERARDRAARAYDRSYHPEGMARQMAAIVASGSRKKELAAVRAPTLVIHGRADPLVPVEAGIDTHESIPGSELLLIEGMGHDLPVGAWPAIIDAITGHTAKVG